MSDPTKPTAPLTYLTAAALDIPGCVTTDQLKALAAKLEKARDETISDIAEWQARQTPQDDKKPTLDAGFINLPENLLKEFHEQGDDSELGKIQAVGNKIAENFDRVVVLGIGGSYMGARALMEACCHTYHNEVDRETRNHRPRIYFEGNNVDNDAFQDLLDLLAQGKGLGDDDRWAVVVISKSGGTLETAGAFRQLLDQLGVDAQFDEGKHTAARIYPITGPSGKLRDLASALNCPDVFTIPDGVGGRFSILTAVGLLPAAILGLDIKALLEGAAAMNEHFRTAAADDNIVLQYVGLGHLAEKNCGMSTRILSTWGKKLEATGLWYDQLLSESLGKNEQGALPLTVVNTRDLHSRGQQHQEGFRDKLITNLVVDENQRENLSIGSSDLNQDELNELANKTYPEILNAALKGTNLAYQDANRPTTDLHFPKLDERSMGKFFQMMMLATVAEGRLIEINPYGQPGVEAYKRNMNEILRS